MNLRSVWLSWIALPLVVLIAAPPAQSQIQDLSFRLHGGVAVPLAAFGEYFDFGPQVGLDVGYPLRDGIDLLMDLDFEYINKHQFYTVPNMRLWRYRLGVEADLLGDRRNNRTLLRAHVGAGGTTFNSPEFHLQNRPFLDGERIESTHFTGTGGVRLGLRTDSGVVWWLGGKVNWSPLSDDDTDILREATRQELSALGSATSFAITLGFNLNRLNR